MIPPAPAPVLTGWFAPFASAFTAPTLRGVLILMTGAILAPGRRTVTSALSILGLREIATFTTFHRVLNATAGRRAISPVGCCKGSSPPSCPKDRW